jgi:hypothetical protein
MQNVHRSMTVGQQPPTRTPTAPLRAVVLLDRADLRCYAPHSPRAGATRAGELLQRIRGPRDRLQGARLITPPDPPPQPGFSCSDSSSRVLLDEEEVRKSKSMRSTT